MEYQGTPMSGGSGGQKVTTDPRSNIPKQEGTGYVAPDSLAAESDAFQRANPNSEPSDSGNSSRIIGKTEVQPLRDEGRSGGGVGNSGSGSGSGGGSYGGGDSGSGGIGNTTGVIGKTELAPLTSATGGIGHISGAGETVPDTGPGGSLRGATEGRGGDERTQGEEAPSYITNVVGATGGAPKGRNLQEGGFEGEASSDLPDPGSKDDPARRAVHDIEERNAISAEATGPRDAAISGGGFSDLDPTRHAPHSGV